MAIGFANPAGEALLQRGDGLLVKNGRLMARLLADDRCLTAAIYNACGPSVVPVHPPGRSGSQVRAPLSQYAATRAKVRTGPPYFLYGASMRYRVASKTHAVLFVDDPNDAGSPSSKDLYTRAFRLTPAEARLAVHLASGASLTKQRMSLE